MSTIVPRPVGIMQGRLLPPINGKIQAFPAARWEEEFRLAQDLGIDEIEFIFDASGFAQNPLLSEAGLRRIKELSAAHGVRVRALCLDYFMEHPLWSNPGPTRPNGPDLLRRLLNSGRELGAQVLNLPLLGKGDLRVEGQAKPAVEHLRSVIDDFEKSGIRLGLETSLPPEPLHELMHLLENPWVGVNYDSGNSTQFGFRCREELETYGHHIVSVHIKDATKGGPSVPLGTGEADFGTLFEWLVSSTFQGSITVQAARGPDERDYVGSQMRFVRERLSR